MKNYKALKAANKASVAKVKVIDVAKVDEVKNDDGVVTTNAVAERSHEELQLTVKKYNPDTGAELDDKVIKYELTYVATQIAFCKSQVTEIEAEQSELEELEKDLKAL